MFREHRLPWSAFFLALLLLAWGVSRCDTDPPVGGPEPEPGPAAESAQPPPELPTGVPEAAPPAPEEVESSEPTADAPAEDAWVEGVLHDADGAALVGARVRVAAPPAWRALTVKRSADGWSTPGAEFLESPGFGLLRVLGRVWSLGAEIAVTDENGRFALPPPREEGTYSLLVHPALGAPSPARILHRIPDVGHRSGRRVLLGVVRLPRPGSIHGFVKDEAGNPVPNRIVWRIPTDFGVSLAALAEETGAPARRGNLPKSPLSAVPSAHTDAEGRFLLERVPPGAYLVTAGSRSAPRTVTVTDGGEAGPVRLVAAAARPPYISGQVVDADTGLPVKARISFGFRTTRSMGSGRARPTAPDGTFLLHSLKPASYTIRVEAAGYKPAVWGPHRLSADEQRRNVEIPLERE